MDFSDRLWKAGTDIYHQILAHPFIHSLTDGSLSKAQFQFYIQQDALYLVDFGKALSLLAAKAPSAQRMLDFARFAEGTMVVEKALHEQFFVDFGCPPAVTKAPGCFTYTNYLLATTSLAPYPVGVAALLPCFWIYLEVGKHILKTASPNNPYQPWIDTYAGETFGQLVQSYLAITNEAATDATPGQREAMEHAYVQAARMEWMFWDSAYRLETWQP